ncbi:MAG: hypothetical protein V4666_10505 [Bacteroidota bacterium]
MKKIFLIATLLITYISNAQTIEFGPTIGAHASSIDNANFFEEQPSIGKKLWNINKGFQTIIYFKDPKENSTYAITLNYHNSNYGVRSDKRQNYYSYNTNSFDLGFRIIGEPQKSGRLYLEAALGINIFDTNEPYHGLTSETIAFPELKEAILLKDNEYKLVLGMGYDIYIAKNFISFFEVKASGGFTNITQNSGSYINTYFQFNTGLRYIVNFKKKETNPVE